MGGHAGGPLFEAPLARGPGYDLRIDTGEVIGSRDFTGTTPGPPVVLSGGTRDPFERRAPACPGGPAQPQPEALGAERQAQDAPA